ncbi:MAG TPA: hypothetical protein VFN97_22905 [Actinospica sp.]|nr:hypothetical protein [Actinospica sp.]
MRADRALKTGAVGLAAAAAVAAGYPLLLRRRCLTWGAEPDEVAGAMPGDELLPGAPLVTTRAVTIEAPPAAVWPWLVQMGPGRGGAYTYDWIENLFGLDMHSADRILPEFQDLKPGDVFAMGKGPRLQVEALEPETALVLRSEDGVWVWAFALHPRTEAADATRLVSRNRIALPPCGPGTRAFYRYVMEPGSLVMERRMLLGIRDRVERAASGTQ